MAAGEWEKLADLARSMSEESGFRDTVVAAVRSAPQLVGGCDEAGVSIVHAGGRVTTEASTGDWVEQADALQVELQDGPCVQSIHESETVRTADLREEPRWPRWSPSAADRLGFRSMLCVQLFTSGHTFGCLNMYSDTVDGFDHDDVQAGLALAAHVAVALRGADLVDNLESALASRDVIGQAKGRLVERFGLRSEQAFDVLVRFSQDRNVKLRAVAEEVALKGFDSLRDDTSS
ncbi:GAF and ANTAR domain-containing protein [Aeromicrobium erythreum]|nr:GAF and ANTAR domain-containing protein [Aeromicrobium erythreum]